MTASNLNDVEMVSVLLWTTYRDRVRMAQADVEELVPELETRYTAGVAMAVLFREWSDDDDLTFTDELWERCEEEIKEMMLDAEEAPWAVEIDAILGEDSPLSRADYEAAIMLSGILSMVDDDDNQDRVLKLLEGIKYVLVRKES